MKFINKTDIIYDGSSPIKVGNYKGTVHFKYKKHYYLTEGSKKVSVECCEVLPDSIEVEYFAELREKKYIRIPLVEFEGRQPAFLNQIIATYNCHGFAITNGKYFIDNNDATKIFDDE